MPKWLAPNLITFIGFIMTVINFLLIGYYDWDFTAANYSENLIPGWVWSVAAINILLYYNLGKMKKKKQAFQRKFQLNNFLYFHV